MAFQVVAAEVAATVVLVLDLDGDLRSGSPGASIDCVRI
jgi:hypothetical protein